jgi:uncharacterized RDD family membrane protein YckC
VSYDAPPPPPGEPTPETGATPPPTPPPAVPPYEPPPAQPSYGTPAPPPPAGYPPPPPAAGYPPPAVGYGGAAAVPQPYSDWGNRALGYLIDYAPIIVIYIVGYILALILGQIAGALGALVLLLTWVAAIGWWIWNRAILAGRTGQSLGKRVIGLKLIGEASGQPIGAGLAFVRDLAHIVDSLICYVGWLWPLWDAKRQTMADKIMTTVVIPGEKLSFEAALRSTMPNS